jgi:hypothetical protein
MCNHSSTFAYPSCLFVSCPTRDKSPCSVYFHDALTCLLAATTTRHTGHYNASAPYLAETAAIDCGQNDMSSSTTASASSRLTFQKKQHVRYLERCLTMLPTLYQTEECSRCVVHMLQAAFVALPKCSEIRLTHLHLNTSFL